MASFRGTEAEKAELQRKFEEEELLRKAEHTREIVAKVEEIVKSGDFKGIDLEILTEEQKDKIVKRLQELGYSLSEINKILSAMANGGKEGGKRLFEGEIDVLGFSTEQWEAAFNNLDKLESRIRAAEIGVGAFMNAWGMYHEFVSKKEQARLREFEANNRAQQEALSRRLDAGLINQRQYDQAQKKLELEMRKRQAKAEYEQAKRQLFYTVKSAYYEYYYFGKALAVTNENLALLETLEEVARSQYETGRSPYGAVISFQVEIGKVKDQLLALQESRGPLMARLNAAMNRPVNARLLVHTRCGLREAHVLLRNGHQGAWRHCHAVRGALWVLGNHLEAMGRREVDGDAERGGGRS